MIVNINCYNCCNEDKVNLLLINVRVQNKKLYTKYFEKAYELLEGYIDPFELLRMLAYSKYDFLSKIFETIGYECIECSTKKVMDYILLSFYNYKKFIINNSNEESKLLIKDIDKISFRFLVYPEKPRDYNCIPPTWIKGYLRQALHKMIFIGILDLIRRKDDIDKQKLSCIIFQTYADVIRIDDEGYLFIEAGAKVNDKSINFRILNLVGLLMGSGNMGSYITISLKRSSDECICEYLIGTDKVRVGLILSILHRVMSPLYEDTDFCNRLKSVVLNLDKVLAIVTPCIANAAECTNGSGKLEVDLNYRFFPLTARYPSVYNVLPKEYVFSIVPNNMDYDKLIDDFMWFIDLYARYYVEEILKRV